MTASLIDQQTHDTLPLNVRRTLALVSYFLDKQPDDEDEREYTIVDQVGSTLHTMGVDADFVGCHWQDNNGDAKKHSPEALEVDGYIVGGEYTLGWKDTIDQFYKELGISVRFAVLGQEFKRKTSAKSYLTQEVNGAMNWLRAQEEATDLESVVVGDGLTPRKKARL